jgi:hypothetical protein
LLGKILQCTVAKASVDFCSAAVDCCSAADAYAQTRSTKPTASAKPTLSLEVPSGGAPPQVSVQKKSTPVRRQKSKKDKVGTEPKNLLPTTSASASKRSTWVFSRSSRACSHSWASPSNFSSSATRFFVLSFSPTDQRSKVSNKGSRSTPRTQGFTLTIRLLQSSAELIPLLLHANEGCGSLHLLAIKWLQETQDINLRPTILVTHIFGGYSHRERCSRTRYRFCRTSRRTLTCSSSPASTGVASAAFSGTEEVEAFKAKASPARASSPVVFAVCSIMGAEVCSISRGEEATAPVRSL